MNKEKIIRPIQLAIQALEQARDSIESLIGRKDYYIPEINPGSAIIELKEALKELLGVKFN